MTWPHLMLILWLLAFKLMFCMNCKWNHVFWCSKVSLSLKFIMYILLLIFSLEFDFINCKILLHLKVTKSNFKGLCSIKQRKLYFILILFFLFSCGFYVSILGLLYPLVETNWCLVIIMFIILLYMWIVMIWCQFGTTTGSLCVD